MGVISLVCGGNIVEGLRSYGLLSLAERFTDSKQRERYIEMKRSHSAKLITLTIIATCGILVTSTMSSWAAAYKPINLNIPSQLPQATQGKSYNYSVAARVTGGTGKPYKWSFTGALPSSLRFNASSGKILGVVAGTAPVGTYPLSICVTGGKKGANSKIRNTICKSTNLKVVQGAGTNTPATNGAAGIYSGNVNWPDVSVTTISNTCGAQVMYRTITLQEGAGGAITGSADNGTQISGTRVGSSITVTLQTTRWGARGPFVWQWSGSTLSGTLIAICYNLSTYELLKEAPYTFNLTKSGSSTPVNTLTVSKNGNGQGTVTANTGAINCGSTCQGSYTVGTQVTLSATPSSGSIFSGWSGACTGTSSCSLTINANTSITATFSASASGTYAGNINFPNLTPPSGITGCEAKVIARTVTLVESANGALTGSTNNEKIPTLTGTRSGSTITVTLQSVWGARGPYVWQWTGTSISGTLPAFCWDLSTNALLNEGSYTFTLQRT